MAFRAYYHPRSAFPSLGSYEREALLLRILLLSAENHQSFVLYPFQRTTNRTPREFTILLLPSYMPFIPTTYGYMGTLYVRIRAYSVPTTKFILSHFLRQKSRFLDIQDRFGIILRIRISIFSRNHRFDLALFLTTLIRMRSANQNESFLSTIDSAEYRLSFLKRWMKRCKTINKERLRRDK